MWFTEGQTTSPRKTPWRRPRRVSIWGADYVEIDVWRSLDGVHYIMHDPKLDRTTNGRGLIALRTSRYIDRLDAGSCR